MAHHAAMVTSDAEAARFVAPSRVGTHTEMPTVAARTMVATFQLVQPIA